ncbi:GNAT family N-acetyltransferase [Methanomassiliicoccus luminyensis]|uniref:GNAT family N-acetyltransferase n=1 Tax=Methanomassiliicoccus luminyensis TaxID=1080712 RepID=UPI0003747D32|nr:GNAT family protein [Methanomassiliicoccus luminyensis]
MPLRGEKVTLRAVEWGDLPHFVDWLNDPEVNAHLMSNPLAGLEEQEQWYHDLQGTDERVLSVEAEDGRLIGNCGIIKLEWEDRRCSLWLAIGEKDVWDRGYGTDVVRTMLRYLFDEMDLNRVYLNVAEANARAIRAYEKCGFRKEGVMRKARFKNGRYENDVLMSILQEEWRDL